MKKTITSRSYIRSPNSIYLKDRCGLFGILGLLGVITNVCIRRDDKLDGKMRYYVELQSEVRDVDQR